MAGLLVFLNKPKHYGSRFRHDLEEVASARSLVEILTLSVITFSSSFALLRILSLIILQKQIHGNHLSSFNSVDHVKYSV